MRGGSDNCTIQYCLLDRADELVFPWQTKYVGGGDNLLMDGANGNEIKYSKFFNNRHDAININAAPGSTVNNNNIHHCEFRTSTDYGRALDIHGVTPGVESNNEFHHNYIHHLTMGIEFGGDHNKFYYNIVDTVTYPSYWTSVAGRNIDAYGIYLLANGDPRICQYNQLYNNYFANTQGVGVRFSNNAGCIGNELMNNIFYNCGLDAAGNPDLYRVAVWIPDAGTGWQRLENNLIYHPTQTNTILYRVYYDRAKHDVAWFNGQNGSNGDMLQNNIAADPLVLPDYRVQSGSPARDAGSTIGSGVDYWDDPVPYNGRVDIGVQEWRPTGASTLLPPVLLSPPDGTGGLPSTVRTRWARSAQASSYQIQVSGTPAFTSTAFERTSVTDTALDVGPLTAGIKYYWRVRLTNGSTLSEYSPVWSFTTLPETVATKPDDISAQGTVVALITSPRGSGSKSLDVIRDNVMPGTNSTDPGLQYDTWDGAVRTSDWIGYTFSGDRTFTHLVFQEGLRYAPAGGWFRQLRVQVRSAGVWSDAVNLTSDPAYSSTSLQSFGTYDLKFEPAVGDGIRIAGQPGGNDTYISVAELRVYGGVATAPVAPTILAPLAGATGQSTVITVRWRRAIGATSYQVQLALDPAFSQVVLDDSTPTDTLRTIGPLAVSTTYYVRVNSRNRIGASGFSAGVGFTTGASQPTSPVILAPNPGATDQPTTITAQWTKPSGATSFHLQLARDGTFTTLVVNDSTLTDSLRTVGPLEVATSYFLRVRSRNQVGASGFSTVVQFTTRGPDTPSATPAVLAPVPGATNQPTTLTARWTKPTGATSFHLQLARDETFTTLVVNDSTLTDSLRTVGPLAVATSYFLRVRSRNQVGASAFSAGVGFTTEPGTVTAPTTSPVILTPIPGATDQPTTLTVRWTRPSGATSFHLQLARDATFTNMVINDSTLTDSLWTVGPLAFASSYFLRVRSRNQQGVGPFSVSVGFSTTDAPRTTPGAPALAQPPNNAALPAAVVTLTWTPVAEVSSYEVHVARDSLFSAVVVDSVVVRSQVALTAVATGERYFWRVRSRTPQGTSDFSPVWKFNVQPTSAYLSQNYPNPFNPSTIIVYNLETPGYVELKVYSVLGQEVATIVSEVETPGLHRVEFDIKNVRGGQNALASGVYFYRLKTDKYSETRKMILRK
jgi:hypothetical protein